MRNHRFRHLVVVCAAIAGSAMPSTTYADVDDPSAAFDRELVIEDVRPDPPAGLELWLARHARARNHALDLELATDYGVDDDSLVGTLRALYTYKPWAQLRISAAATQSGSGDAGLQQSALSAGLGATLGEAFSGRVTLLAKIAERVDATTMETSMAVTPGIDVQVRFAPSDGRFVTSGRIGVRFSEETTVLGVLSEAYRFRKRFGIRADLSAAVTASGDTSFEAGLNATVTGGQFEFGVGVSTALDDPAMILSASMTGSFGP